MKAIRDQLLRISNISLKIRDCARAREIWEKQPLIQSIIQRLTHYLIESSQPDKRSKAQVTSKKITKTPFVPSTKTRIRYKIGEILASTSQNFEINIEDLEFLRENEAENALLARVKGFTLLETPRAAMLEQVFQHVPAHSSHII